MEERGRARLTSAMGGGHAPSMLSLSLAGRRQQRGGKVASGGSWAQERREVRWARTKEERKRRDGLPPFYFLLFLYVVCFNIISRKRKREREGKESK